MSEVLSVMRFVADVAAQHAAPARQREHLVNGLQDLVGFDQSFFFVCDGWWPGLAPRITDTTLARTCGQAFLDYGRDWLPAYSVTADPYCGETYARRQRHVTVSQDEVLPNPAVWRRYAPFMDLIRTHEFRDGVISYQRTGSDGARMFGVGLHRLGSSPKIGPKERAKVALAVAELGRLVDSGHMALEPASPPAVWDPADLQLPPRLREVLALVLVGRHVKGIAADLGLSVWTVRDYIKALYRHCDVSSREELMARFVRDV